MLKKTAKTKHLRFKKTNIMKALKLFLITIFLSMVSLLNAQSNFINYQGVAKNAAGDVLANENIIIQLSLRYGTSTTPPSFTENHNVTTNANGLFSLQIGSGTTINGNYNNLVWGEADAFLSVSIDAVFVGTTELHSVPFAISSADSQWGKNGNRIFNKNSGNVGIGEENPTGKLHITKAYTTTPFLKLESFSGDRADISFTKTGSNSNWDQIAGIRTDAASGTMSFYYNDNGTSNHIVTFRGDRKMGLNTTNPAATLDVNGDFRIQNGTTINELSTDGNLSGNSDAAIPTEKAVKKYVDDRSGSRYFESGSLTTDFFNLDTTLRPIGITLNITKARDNSKIEVTLNSRIRVGNFSSSSGAYFEIRIDGNAPNYDNRGSMPFQNSSEFISMLAVFQGLSAGNHTIQLYGATQSGTISNVLIDPGNYGGRMVAKETF